MGKVDEMDVAADSAAALDFLMREQGLARSPAEQLVEYLAAARAALEQSRSIPIVFASLNDPVTSGLIQNVSQPEGNITGFALYEPSMGGKWLALLKEAVPTVSVLQPAAALRCRNGGVCDGALLGTRVGRAWPRGAADAGAIRQGLRQAQ
jgi:hypothetical protein